MTIPLGANLRTAYNKVLCHAVLIGVRARSSGGAVTICSGRRITKHVAESWDISGDSYSCI